MRKNRPLSSAVDSAGEVADGEIITTPFGTATLARIAPVTPEQSAPTMPLTPSEVIRRSATAVAAPASMQVESPRIGVTRRAVQKRARVADLLHRQFGARRHVGRDRFQRPGEAEDDAELDLFLGERRTGDERGRGGGQKQFLHWLVSLTGHKKSCRNT